MHFRPRYGAREQAAETPRHVALYSRSRRGTRVALRAKNPPSVENGRRTWMQIAYEGEWAGHHSGAFELTREIFEQMIANFRSDGEAFPLTYGHPDPETAAYHGAAGWGHDLALRDGPKGAELWAQVELTERAAEMVKAGELGPRSIVAYFDSADPVSGEPRGAELAELGMVLSPFLRGMKPARI